MQVKSLVLLAFSPLSLAAPQGSTCTADDVSGTCLRKGIDRCSGGSFIPGHCPRPTDIQCCIKSPCKGVSGSCLSVQHTGCAGGTFLTGKCPGSTDFKCCHKDAAPKPPPTKPAPPAWPQCWETLSCTFAQIAGASMASRLDSVKYMESHSFGSLGASDRYRAIEGVITFFGKENLGAPESWVSYVDAGIVEGIERGGAIALGISTADGGNPGTAKWTEYLRRRRDGTLKSRDVRTPAGAETEYGARRADAKFSRSTRERNWFWATQLFRWIMRNRGKAILALRLYVPLLGSFCSG